MKTQTLALASVAVVLGASSALAQSQPNPASEHIQTVIGQMNTPTRSWPDEHSPDGHRPAEYCQTTPDDARRRRTRCRTPS